MQPLNTPEIEDWPSADQQPERVTGYLEKAQDGTVELRIPLPYDAHPDRVYIAGQEYVRR